MWTVEAPWLSRVESVSGEQISMITSMEERRMMTSITLLRMLMKNLLDHILFFTIGEDIAGTSGVQD